MGRISRTMQLARASWEVLKADKELIALPVISLLSTLVVAASFLVPMAWVGRSETDQNPAWVILPLAFAAYLVLAYITIFFNAALIHAANERLEGGDPTVGSALRGAASRAGRLFPWALLSATVSALLRAVEERAGVVGKVISGIAGMAWSLVTFLVLPILVMEDLRVGDALKRSANLFKGTWGENIAARAGFGLLGFVAVLPGIAAIAGAFALGSSTDTVTGAMNVAVNPLLLTVGVIWILAVAMVLAALSGIFQTALYRYAAGKPSQGAFSSDTLQGAFGAK
ncbi:MAG: hypothetical protein JW785_07895 [Acidimicrobiia bacterium]|nr:hypothetical protein [Acidimicrobiia bacterium]